MNLDIRADEPCAAAGREPCQAGNRAALTGVSLCDADSLSVRISKCMTPRPRPVLLSIYLLERGENFVSGALVAASGVLRRSGTASGNGDFTE